MALPARSVSTPARAYALSATALLKRMRPDATHGGAPRVKTGPFSPILMADVPTCSDRRARARAHEGPAGVARADARADRPRRAPRGRAHRAGDRHRALRRLGDAVRRAARPGVEHTASRRRPLAAAGVRRSDRRRGDRTGRGLLWRRGLVGKDDDHRGHGGGPEVGPDPAPHARGEPASLLVEP